MDRERKAVDAMTPEHDDLVTTPAVDWHLRPARDGEIGVAIAIDDDACTAYPAFHPDYDVTLPKDHPFARAEAAHWTESIATGRTIFACASAGDPVGFAALGFIDGRPWLQQVSVRRAWSGRGIGRALLEHAKRWSAPHHELWLTTYAAVPWNAAWYERLGFTRCPESRCGPELCDVLRAERAALPRPQDRIAMVYRHAGT